MSSKSVEIADTEVGTLAFAHTVYNVNRIAYHEGDKYDLMLQYYIPFDLSKAPEIIRSAKKKFDFITDGDEIDLSEYVEDSDEIYAFLDNYTRAIQSCDIEGFMSMNWIFDYYAEILYLGIKEYATKKPSNEQVVDLYKDAYQAGMISLNNEMQIQFGNDYVVHYKVCEFNKTGKQTLAEFNRGLHQIGIEDNVDEQIQLEIHFWVSGNQNSDYCYSSFYYPIFSMDKINGSWRLNTSDHFPSPDISEVLKLYGVEI